MKNPFRHDPAFRVAFSLLVALSLAILLWQCSLNSPGPSRVGWPPNSTGPKQP